MPSSIPTCTTRLTPSFPTGTHTSETPSTSALIKNLSMVAHPEGGYFTEIDRDERLVANPFLDSTGSLTNPTNAEEPTIADPTRNASTSILYLLTPHRPQGNFHRNKARTVHTLIAGRGRYVVIHDDSDSNSTDNTGGSEKRLESFTVGHDVSAGEKAIWIVEGGKYKASYLLPELPENDGGEEVGESRLLISETVVPGFEFKDHDFLTWEGFEGRLTREQVDELGWLVRRE